jgi:hypothetical protein
MRKIGIKSIVPWDMNKIWKRTLLQIHKASFHEVSGEKKSITRVRFKKTDA